MLLPYSTSAMNFKYKGSYRRIIERSRKHRKNITVGIENVGDAATLSNIATHYNKSELSDNSTINVKVNEISMASYGIIGSTSFMGVTINVDINGGVVFSEVLADKNNIINILVHENFHKDNYGVGVDVEGSDAAVVNHLDAYHAQVSHNSFTSTTTKFKRAIIGNINNYISQIEDEGLRGEQQDRFNDYTNEQE